MSEMTGAQSLITSLEAAGVEHDLRHPGRRHPPGVRPAHGQLRSATSSYATSRGPATPPRGTPPRPAGSACAWRPPAPARPTWSPRSPTPSWTRCRSWPSPARSAPRRSAPTPSRRPTSAASRCRSPSTTSWSPTRPRSRASIAEAFYIASTGRPGPVLVDVAKSALQATTDYEWPTELRLPGYRPVTRPHSKQIREATRLMLEARRPVLYVGGGVVRARASTELARLAELTGIPVVTTLMARGAFPDSHPQHLGMPGMHGTVAAVAGPAEERPDHQPRRAVRRPGHRQPRLVRPRRAGDPRRHRPRRDRQEPPRRRPDRGRRPRGDRRPDRRAAGRGGRRPHRRLRGLGRVPGRA